MEILDLIIAEEGRIGKRKIYGHETLKICELDTLCTPLLHPGTGIVYYW